ETWEAGMADYATLLRDHVTLTCRSVDRILLQAYVPRLQSVGMVCQFLRWQRGFFIPSSAAFGKIGEACTAGVHKFATAGGIPVARWGRGGGRGGTAGRYRGAGAAAGTGGGGLIGTARESPAPASGAAGSRAPARPCPAVSEEGRARI